MANAAVEMKNPGQRLDSTSSEALSSSPAAADTEDDKDEERLCRVCRGESTVEQPLYYPCKCKGSIKWVHQECLMTWLEHSQISKCELCRHSFEFNPLYAPDTPDNESAMSFATVAWWLLEQSRLFWPRVLRCSFYLGLWVTVVPLGTAIGFRMCMYDMSPFSAAPTTQDDLFPSFKLGLVVSCVVLLISVGWTLIRDVIPQVIQAFADHDFANDDMDGFVVNADVVVGAHDGDFAAVDANVNADGGGGANVAAANANADVAPPHVVAVGNAVPPVAAAGNAGAPPAAAAGNIDVAPVAAVERVAIPPVAATVEHREAVAPPPRPPVAQRNFKDIDGESVDESDEEKTLDDASPGMTPGDTGSAFRSRPGAACEIKGTEAKEEGPDCAVISESADSVSSSSGTSSKIAVGRAEAEREMETGESSGSPSNSTLSSSSPHPNAVNNGGNPSDSNTSLNLSSRVATKASRSRTIDGDSTRDPMLAATRSAQGVGNFADIEHSVAETKGELASSRTLSPADSVDDSNELEDASGPSPSADRSAFSLDPEENKVMFRSYSDLDADFDAAEDGADFTDFEADSTDDENESDSDADGVVADDNDEDEVAMANVDVGGMNDEELAQMLQLEQEQQDADQEQELGALLEQIDGELSEWMGFTGPLLNVNMFVVAFYNNVFLLFTISLPLHMGNFALMFLQIDRFALSWSAFLAQMTVKSWLYLETMPTNVVECATEAACKKLNPEIAAQFAEVQFDRVFCVALGWAFVLSVMFWVFVAEVMSSPETRIMPFLRQVNVVGKHILSGAKVSFCLCLELVVFPMMMGFAIELLTYDFHGRSPPTTITVTFLVWRWVVGAFFMLSITVFVGALRKVVRARILAKFLRNPEELENFDDIFNSSLLRHVSRLLMSACIYLVFVYFLVHVPIKILVRSFPSVFPMKLGMAGDTPWALGVFHLGLPVAWQSLKMGKVFDSFVKWWFLSCSKVLAIQGYLIKPSALREREREENNANEAAGNANGNINNDANGANVNVNANDIAPEVAARLAAAAAAAAAAEDEDLMVPNANDDDIAPEAAARLAAAAAEGEDLMVPLVPVGDNDVDGEDDDNDEDEFAELVDAGTFELEDGELRLLPPMNERTNAIDIDHFPVRVLALIVVTWGVYLVFAMLISVVPYAIGRFFMNTVFPMFSGLPMHEYLFGMYTLFGFGILFEEAVRIFDVAQREQAQAAAQREQQDDANVDANADANLLAAGLHPADEARAAANADGDRHEADANAAAAANAEVLLADANASDSQHPSSFSSSDRSSSTSSSSASSSSLSASHPPRIQHHSSTSRSANTDTDASPFSSPASFYQACQRRARDLSRRLRSLRTRFAVYNRWLDKVNGAAYVFVVFGVVMPQCIGVLLRLLLSRFRSAAEAAARGGGVCAAPDAFFSSHCDATAPHWESPFSPTPFDFAFAGGDDVFSSLLGALGDHLSSDYYQRFFVSDFLLGCFLMQLGIKLVQSGAFGESSLKTHLDKVTADGLDNVDVSYINKHLLPVALKNIGFHLVLPALVAHLFVPSLFHFFPAEMLDLSAALSSAMHRNHLMLAEFSDNFPLLSWVIIGPLDFGFFAEDVPLKVSVYEHFVWLRFTLHCVEWLHGSYARLKKRVFAEKYLIGKELQNYPQEPAPEVSRSAKAEDSTRHPLTTRGGSPEDEAKSDNDSPMPGGGVFATERLPGGGSSAGHAHVSSSSNSDKAPRARPFEFESGESKEACSSSAPSLSLSLEATTNSSSSSSPSAGASAPRFGSASERIHSGRSQSHSSSAAASTGGGLEPVAATGANPNSSVSSSSEFRLDADALTLSVGTARAARPRHSGVGLDALSPSHDSRRGSRGLF